MHTLYISLGSNWGDKEGNIRRALALVGERVGQVLACSSMLVTEPWGFRSKHKFVNVAARVATELSPRGALDATQAIERAMGRTEKSAAGRYHDRIIDIDLLLYDDLRVDEVGLCIPHRLMFEREFVMAPLRETLDERGRELVDRLQEEWRSRRQGGC